MVVRYDFCRDGIADCYCEMEESEAGNYVSHTAYDELKDAANFMNQRREAAEIEAIRQAKCIAELELERDTFENAVAMALDQRDELEAENQRLREALDTELVCCGIGTLDSMESPKHAVAAIGRWHYDLGASGVLEGEQE